MEKYGGMPEGFLPILKIAQECFENSGAERPEAVWLKERFDIIRKRYSLGTKRDTDRFVYEMMFGKPAKTETDCLKIRYWRTGKYRPINREQCRLLGKALELTDQEMSFLIRGYYDRSEIMYPDDHNPEECGYNAKCRRMSRLVQRYLEKVPADKMESLRIDPEQKEHYFRHLYFTDAFYYVSVLQQENPETLRKHITSIRYDSEIRRQMKFIGEIPRKTMIRHLIILGAPDITLEWMNTQLDFFGFLPLCREHTMAGGEYLDRLLICLLQEYEKVYERTGRENSLEWLREICRILDGFYKKRNCPHMRFMYFKSMEL